MAGIGEAASVIAIIDLSVKVASLCVQYSREVAGAKKEITSLQEELGALQNVLNQLNKLLDQPNGAKLSTAPGIKRALGAIKAQLQDVDKMLDIEKSRNPLRRYGLRAMKWPFESKTVEKIMARLEHHKSAITLALQVDQTYVIISSLSLYMYAHQCPKQIIARCASS
jgi:metal-responsive CopG/Arc/MetJ family transcriptional regulator